MASITHGCTPLNRVGEKGFPLSRQQAVFLAHGLVAHDVTEIGQVLGADRADQPALIDSQGGEVLAAQIGAADVVVGAGIGANGKKLLCRALVKTHKKSTVLL